MSAETPRQRRDRRRAEESNLTDEQLRHREDEQFRRTADEIRDDAEINRQREEARQTKASRPTEKAKTKRMRETDALAQRAKRLRAKGLTYKKIAGEIDRDVSTVPRLLKRPD